MATQTNTTQLRMLNLFGKREMELAAIRILDIYWERPYMHIDPKIFQDEMEKEGFSLLKERGWISHAGIPRPDFWKRVHGR